MRILATRLLFPQRLNHDASSLRLSTRLPLPLSHYNNPTTIRPVPLRALFDHVKIISGHSKSCLRRSWSTTRPIHHQWTTWLRFHIPLHLPTPTNTQLLFKACGPPLSHRNDDVCPYPLLSVNSKTQETSTQRLHQHKLLPRWKAGMVRHR